MDLSFWWEGPGFETKVRFRVLRGQWNWTKGVNISHCYCIRFGVRLDHIFTLNFWVASKVPAVDVNRISVSFSIGLCTGCMTAMIALAPAEQQIWHFSDFLDDVFTGFWINNLPRYGQTIRRAHQGFLALIIFMIFMFGFWTRNIANCTRQTLLRQHPLRASGTIEFHIGELHLGARTNAHGEQYNRWCSGTIGRVLCISVKPESMRRILAAVLGSTYFSSVLTSVIVTKMIAILIVVVTVWHHW